MAQLVILGHKTRSKEVIEILEMLGGRNSRDYVCNVPGYAYSINEQGIIDLYISHSNSSITFTLEEFLEKFPYKVGDKVLLSGVVKIIKQVCWSDTENEVIYKLETNVRGFSEEYHVHHYDLQSYKEETMEKINVAKLLEDCPRGMELDCILFDAKIIYQGLSKRTPTHPIVVQTEHGFEFELTQYGQIHNIVGSNCVIYPKGKTTWEGFVPPCQFKDGDIIAMENKCGIHIFIYNHTTNEYNGYGYHVIFTSFGNFKIDGFCGGNTYRLATEKEKQKLFKAIKDNGYKWNLYTKTLEKLIELKFKVGDKIRGKYTHNIYTISCITPTEYNLTNGQSFTFGDEDCFELVSNKFDITTLKPFAEVLVRNTNNGRWHGQLYMSYNENEEYPFECVYNCWKQCIPYEGNEYLLNTTDDCDEYFKTWQ